MEVIDKLKSKNIKVTEVDKWGPYFRKRWEDSFAGHMSYDEKKAIYLYDDDGACGFLWHIFSYEKRKCLKGEEAKRAFDVERKDFCYIFYQLSDVVLILEKASGLIASDLDTEFDVYVADKEFNWTYVKTHEEEYGDRKSVV